MEFLLFFLIPPAYQTFHCQSKLKTWYVLVRSYYGPRRFNQNKITRGHHQDVVCRLDGETQRTQCTSTYLGKYKRCLFSSVQHCYMFFDNFVWKKLKTLRRCSFSKSFSLPFSFSRITWKFCIVNLYSLLFITVDLKVLSTNGKDNRKC